jgi:hypothetical protein
MLIRAISILLILSAAVLLFFASIVMANSVGVRDMVQYWAAAHLLTENPYSGERTRELEIQAGMPSNRHTMVMPNPPWAMPFVLPFRFMSYRIAFAFWTVFTLATVAGCARVLWHFYTDRNSLAPAFISLLFGPTLTNMMLGQFAVLGLLGITLFLWLIKKRRDWWAGASLLLVVIKPHVVLLFLLVVLFWLITNKRWAVIGGAAISFAAATGTALLLDPVVFQQYFHYAHRFTQEQVPYPNLGGILFLLTKQHLLALLPTVVGVFWVVYYWRRHRDDWDMTIHGPLVILVSLVCTYYSYSYDEIITLPALLGAAAMGKRAPFLLGFILVELGYLFFWGNAGAATGWDYMILSWVSVGLLLTYLASMCGAIRQNRTAVVLSAD